MNTLLSLSSPLHLPLRNIKPRKWLFLSEPAIIAALFSSYIIIVSSFFPCGEFKYPNSETRRFFLKKGECNNNLEIPVSSVCEDLHGDCKRVGPVSETISYGCPSNSYNAGASLMLPEGSETIKHLFATGFHYQLVFPSFS